MEDLNKNEVKKKTEFIRKVRDFFDKGTIYWSYFNWILLGIKWELKYTDIVHASGKHILKHIDVVPINSREEAIEYFTEIYDTYHPLRNSIETMDSIEEIRQELKKNPRDGRGEQ